MFYSISLIFCSLSPSFAYSLNFFLISSTLAVCQNRYQSSFCLIQFFFSSLSLIVRLFDILCRETRSFVWKIIQNLLSCPLLLLFFLLFNAFGAWLFHIYQSIGRIKNGVVNEIAAVWRKKCYESTKERCIEEQMKKKNRHTTDKNTVGNMKWSVTVACTQGCLCVEFEAIFTSVCVFLKCTPRVWIS